MPRDLDDFGTSFAGRVWRSSTVLVLGALLGVLFILAAGAFQYWIEDHAIKTQVSLEQGASSTVTVAADKVDPANDGKLVHVTGEATTNEKLTDPDFGISVQALRLLREVELYQWKETKSEVKKDSKKIITYKYAQVWSKDKPAKGFTEPAGHVNPPEKPYADTKLDAKGVKLGAFALSHKQVDRLPADEILPVTEEMLSQAPASLKGRLVADPEGYLFVGSQPGHTPDAPQVGDVRIRYKVAKPQTITVVAKQTQGGFEPFTPEGGEHVDLLKAGSHGVQALFEGAQSKNQLVGWVTRVFTGLLMTLGLFFVVRLWKNIGREKTGGGLYDFGLFFLAIGFAIPLTMAVVGSRWVLHQPSIGGGLLGGGLLATVGLLFLARNRKRPPSAHEPESVLSYEEPVPDESHALISRAIELGAPVYNNGDPAACYEIYAATARSILKSSLGTAAAKNRLRRALEQCGQLTDPDEKAWAMRHAFDAILAGIVEETIDDEGVLPRGKEKPDHMDIALERITDEKPDKKKDH